MQVQSNLTSQSIIKHSQLKDQSKVNPSSLYKANQEVVSNFYTFDFANSKDVSLYSLIIYHKTKGNENPYYSMIKKISRNIEAKKIIREYFSDFYISGNSLFGKPKVKTDNKSDVKTAKVSFRIGWKDDKLEIRKIDEPEFGYEDEFIFSIFWKFDLKEFNDFEKAMEKENDNIKNEIEKKQKQKELKNEKEHVRRFLNIIIQKYLEDMGYIKTEPGPKAVYYKKGLCGDHMISISDGVYFVSGFKVNTNFYEGNQILIKTVQKFRMVREQSYFDYYQYKISNNNFNCAEDFYEYFQLFIKNRCGLAKHTEKRVRINSIKFNQNLHEFKFPRKRKGENGELIQDEISMHQYYKDRYGIDLTPIQPLAEEVEIRKGFNNQKITKTIYFPIELLFIIGKLDEDKFDISKATLLPPTHKFNKTHTLMRELKANLGKINPDDRITKSTNMNFNLKLIKSNILKMPLIEFGENRMLNPEAVTGNFEIKGTTPYINEDLQDWIIFTYDIFDDEMEKIGNLFSGAKGALGMKYKDPKLEKIPSNLKGNALIQSFVDYFENLKAQKLAGKSNIEFAMLILSRRHEYIYQHFKNAINISDSRIRSQVVKKESLLKRGLTVASNVLLQIWAKRALPIWRSKELKKQVNMKNVMICGYSVGYSSITKKGITSLSASLNSDFTDYANYCEFHDSSSKFSTHIGNLLEKACEIYKKINKKDPSKIILYREGLNGKQRENCLVNEGNSIKCIDRLAKIPLTIIFVNKQCDLRFYLEDKNNLDSHMSKLNLLDQSFQTCFELNQTKISLSDEKIYTNLLPGSVIESGITEEGNNEFYLISSYSVGGTSNPTHYIVGLDECLVDKNILYKLTYDLTFLYFNNTKCIRIPFPL